MHVEYSHLLHISRHIFIFILIKLCYLTVLMSSSVQVVIMKKEEKKPKNIQLNPDFQIRFFKAKQLTGIFLKSQYPEEILSEKIEISQQGDRALKTLIQGPGTGHRNTALAVFSWQIPGHWVRDFASILHLTLALFSSYKYPTRVEQRTYRVTQAQVFFLGFKLGFCCQLVDQNVILFIFFSLLQFRKEREQKQVCNLSLK